MKINFSFDVLMLYPLTIEVKLTLLLGRRLVFVIVFLCLSSELPDYREALFLFQVDTLLLNRLHSDTDTLIDTDKDIDTDIGHRQRRPFYESLSSCVLLCLVP